LHGVGGLLTLRIQHWEAFLVYHGFAYFMVTRIGWCFTEHLQLTGYVPRQHEIDRTNKTNSTL
jgi:hypothetical protein